MKEGALYIVAVRLIPSLSCGYMAGKLNIEVFTLILKFISGLLDIAAVHPLAVPIIIVVLVIGLLSSWIALLFLPFVPFIYGYFLWILAILIVFKDGISPIVEPMQDFRFWLYGIAGFIEAFIVQTMFFRDLNREDVVKEEY